MSGPGLQAVRVVGGLVPPGLFAKIQTRDVRAPESLTATSYHLSGRETIPDAANRSWTYLRGAWQDWRAFAEAQPPGTPGTGPARERWLLVLMRELGYGQLPALRGGIDVDGVEYPVSHEWQNVPVHLLGPGVDLDRRNPGVGGAARAPQAMVQELLNRSEPHLWAVLSNGLRLRLLRDSTSLAGSAYVEFDLESIFDGELFAEFLLLWQLCHVSRMEKRSGPDAPAADCWIEAWRGEAVEGGTRALKQLRDGVEKALKSLGSGFLAHKHNGWLLDALRTGELSTAAYHRALLRLVYRLLFLSVAEDRGVLLYNASPETADRYTRYFSVGRLRRLSRVRSGGPHGDLWQALVVVLRALGGDGLPALGLPALAGLFDPDDQPLNEPSGAKVDYLLACSLGNNTLLTAMRHLGWIYGKNDRVQPVDYRNLGAEELGSVYESLLELVPRLDLIERTFTLEHLAGNERKTTGSYYTPSSLVSALLDSALDPLLDDAQKNAIDNADAVQRLLSLRVCDPACGSGHFLVAAARRIARRVAQLRSGDEEPTPFEVQHALREVVGSCIYGVDVNPFAAELAKVSLWIEALEPGKPLGFLDARIRIGNSLLGTTPALLSGGVPDEAFKELEGDDKKIAAATRKLNKKELEGQFGLWETELSHSNAELAKRRERLIRLTDSPEQVRSQGRSWQRYNSEDQQLTVQRNQADAWCAAFIWKHSLGNLEAPTSSIVRGFASNPDSQSVDIRVEVTRLSMEYRFFHWHLEFPEIFAVGQDGSDTPSPDGWTGGFSCLIGNPPWERIAFEDEEFFSQWAPEILNTDTTSERKHAIRQLIGADAFIAKEYNATRSRLARISHLIASSGVYPLTARGRLTTQAAFAEQSMRLITQAGRVGIIVPTGVLTDVPLKDFWKFLSTSSRLRAVIDFSNAREIFPGVHRSTKFSILVATGGGSSTAETQALRIGVFLEDPQELQDSERLYDLPVNSLSILNPITSQMPICRSRRDMGLLLEMSIAAYPSQQVTPWVGFTSEGHSKYFLKEDIPTNSTPLYEGKMIHQYDSNFATYSDASGLTTRKPRPTPLLQKSVPSFPQFFCSSLTVDKFLARKNEHNPWVLVVRDYVRSTDEHTAIATIVPRTVPIQPLNGFSVPSGAQAAAWALAAINSFPYDFMAKQKTPGQHFNVTIMSQIPIPAVRSSWLELVTDGVAELIYTNTSLTAFALELGIHGDPFAWDEERRLQIRCELDALFFYLYGVDRKNAEYILTAFPIVKRKDEVRFGEYRTERLVLEAYDRISQAIHTGDSLQSVLDPPAGHGRRHPVKQEGQ